MILLFAKEKGNKIGLDLAEGVDPNRFLVDSAVASNPGTVQELFTAYNYNLKGSNGLFAKVYTANLKELNEIKNSLDRINEMGLKDVVESSNMKISSFKKAFLDRVELCFKNGIPFLNQDNTFIKELGNDEDIKNYVTSQVSNNAKEESKETVTSASASNNASQEKNELDDKIGMMDEFDKSIFYDTIEKLNYLVLANPTNEAIAGIVRNIPEKLAAAILRQEYQFLGTRGMLNNILESLNVNTNSNEAQMILGAIPEMESNMGRGLAA